MLLCYRFRPDLCKCYTLSQPQTVRPLTRQGKQDRQVTYMKNVRTDNKGKYRHSKSLRQESIEPSWFSLICVDWIRSKGDIHSLFIVRRGGQEDAPNPEGVGRSQTPPSMPEIAKGS